MNDLNKTIRRSQQYWFEDGLVELLIGLLFVVLSGLFWWQISSDFEYAPLIGGIAMPIIIVLGAILLGVTLRWLKQKLIYPRTGYITYAKPTNKRRGMTALIGLVIGGVMGAAITQLAVDELVAAFIGAGIGIGLFMVGIRVGLMRFHVLAILSVAVGVVISFLSVDVAVAPAYALGFIGSILVLSGVFTFWRYWQNSEPGNDEPMEALS